MTELRRCGWCRRALPERSGRGRPRRFCSARCRQWDWVSRQRSRELALSEDELVITRANLDELHDDLYVLACAIEDTEADLESAGPTASATELRRILEWLLQSARPVHARELWGPDVPPPITS